MLHKKAALRSSACSMARRSIAVCASPPCRICIRRFRCSFQMKPMANVNDAVRRLLATGGWLDRFPYEETQGKKFRIVTAQDDHLVSANMRYVDMLEKAICEHTGMHTYRERPDVELWVSAARKPRISCGGLAAPAQAGEGQPARTSARSPRFCALRREERRHSQLHRQRPARGGQGLRRSRADLYLSRPRDSSFDRKQGERNAGLRRLQRIYGFGGRQPERRSDVSAGQGGENRAA